MNYPESFDHMLAAWNEARPGSVCAGISRRHWLPKCVSSIRSADTTGIDEFEANVHAVQARIPGAEYRRSSGVDGHHDLYRYHWEIVRDGELLMPGFDVTGGRRRGAGDEGARVLRTAAGLSQRAQRRSTPSAGCADPRAQRCSSEAVAAG